MIARVVPVFALSAASCAFALSQPPSPSPAKPAQEQQQLEAKKDNSATDDEQKRAAPAATPELNTTPPEAEPEQYARADHQHEPTKDWWYEVFPNIAIAAFTLVLTVVSVYQGYMLWAGSETTEIAALAAKEAADAATKSAAVAERALIAGNRAYVMLKRIDVGPWTSTDGAERGWAIWHCFQNGGNSPAQRVVTTARIYSVQPGEPHPEFEQVDPGVPRQSLSIGPRGEFMSRPLIVTLKDAHEISAKSVAIFIHAEVQYVETMSGKPMHTRVCHYVESRQPPNAAAQEPFSFVSGPGEHNESA